MFVALIDSEAGVVLITHAEMAAELGISRRTLSRIMAQTPGITYLRVGRAIQFRPADVERLMAAFTVSTPGRPTPRVRTSVTVKAGPRQAGMTAREVVLALTSRPKRPR